MRIACAAAMLAAFAVPAPAAVLYKSVSDTGVISFSDLPPPAGMRKVEQIRIPDASTVSTGTPLVSGPTQEELREADAAVGRANVQLDLAEHALAEARRTVAADSDPLRLVSARRSRADNERIDFYKKGVLLARAQLLEVLQQKRKATVVQTLTASNEWTPVSPTARQ